MDFKTQNKHQKNFVPSKKLGQNFLTDDNVAQEIVNLSQIQNYDLVIEVGPGRGALTKHLVVFNKPLIAIELDKRLAEELKHKFHQYSHLEIINNDILEVDLLKISKNYKQVLLISNLPYSISTPMILKFLKQNKITSFVCMLQKEVVDRLIATSHSKTYGAFSVLVQYYASIAKFLNVAPNSFTPIPAVESQVVLISKNRLAFDNRWSSFIRQCFKYKRKTLLNNLKVDYSIELVNKKMAKLKLDSNTRAEELPVNTLFSLYQEMVK